VRGGSHALGRAKSWVLKWALVVIVGLLIFDFVGGTGIGLHLDISQEDRRHLEAQN
jgi:hypothetical protein